MREISDRFKRLLNKEYDRWKVLADGRVVALSRPFSYTNSRIVVDCDEVGFAAAY